MSKDKEINIKLSKRKAFGILLLGLIIYLSIDILPIMFVSIASQLKFLISMFESLSYDFKFIALVLLLILTWKILIVVSTFIINSIGFCVRLIKNKKEEIGCQKIKKLKRK